MARRFRAVPREVRSELDKALEVSAEENVGMKQRLVRKDTGDLADSIKWVRGKSVKVRGALGRTQKVHRTDNFAVTIFTTSFKAPLIELGTRFAAAFPFWFPTDRALQKRVRTRLGRAQGKGIRAAIRKG